MNQADIQLLAAQFQDVLNAVTTTSSTVRSGSTVTVKLSGKPELKFQLTGTAKLSARSF